MVFAYIDELSAASVAGHTDELETSGRVRQRHLERLAAALLRGEPADELIGGRRAGRLEAAADADRRAAARGAGAAGARGDLAGGADPERARAAGGAGRGAGARRGRPVPDQAAEGPRRPARRRRVPPGPWREVRSVVRPRRARARPAPRTAAPLDTEHHLASLVVSADPEALADLRARALAPLATLRPATAEKLEATLRSWLLHQGRREDVAADLFVHPQTVRYRMSQLRELYGDDLDDPETVLALTLALA